MKTKNGQILTFSENMQFSAILCFATCDWFCPMTSHINSNEVFQLIHIALAQIWYCYCGTLLFFKCIFLLQPMTPTDARPDMSKLRLVKESDLRKGAIIGSGAFGTVYKVQKL